MSGSSERSLCNFVWILQQCCVMLMRFPLQAFSTEGSLISKTIPVVPWAAPARGIPFSTRSCHTPAIHPPYTHPRLTIPPIGRAKDTSGVAFCGIRAGREAPSSSRLADWEVIGYFWGSKVFGPPLLAFISSGFLIVFGHLTMISRAGTPSQKLVGRPLGVLLILCLLH